MATPETLQYNMNRLAGTLNSANVPTLDAQGAANVWAATPTPLDLVGALNYLYAKRNSIANQNLALQGVLNALAGTTGLGENLASTLIVS
jgi:hypothetical protein